MSTSGHWKIETITHRDSGAYPFYVTGKNQYDASIIAWEVSDLDHPEYDLSNAVVTNPK